MLSSRSLEEITETACCRISGFWGVHAIIEIWGNDHHLKNRVSFSFTTTLKKKQNEWLQNFKSTGWRKKQNDSLIEDILYTFCRPVFWKKKVKSTCSLLDGSQFPMRFSPLDSVVVYREQVKWIFDQSPPQFFQVWWYSFKRPSWKFKNQRVLKSFSVDTRLWKRWNGSWYGYIQSSPIEK